MSPRLTDQAVSELPLAAARAELLEEIMSTSVADRPTVQHDEGPRRGRRWVATLAAAAAAAALVAVPSWLLSRDDDTVSVYAAPAAHVWVGLDAPGWNVTYISDPRDGGSEVEWANGEATLNVHLYPADLRDSYVKDRQRIDYPRVDRGAPVELLGQPARMWRYSARDRTTIGAVDGAVYPEVRGQGMDEATYVALLARLAWTDEAEFELTLPEEFVTSGEADATIAAMLRGIPWRRAQRSRARARTTPTSSGPTWRARSSARGSPSSSEPVATVTSKDSAPSRRSSRPAGAGRSSTR